MKQEINILSMRGYWVLIYRSMILSLLFLGISSAAEPICAERYSQLDISENLRSLKAIVPENGVKGFVNKTRGSYFFIKSTDGGIRLTFFNDRTV